MVRKSKTKKTEEKQKQEQKQQIKQNIIVNVPSVEKKRRRRKTTKKQQKKDLKIFDERFYQQLPPPSYFYNINVPPQQLINEPEKKIIKPSIPLETEPITVKKPILEDIGTTGTEGFDEILYLPSKRETLESLITPIPKPKPKPKIFETMSETMSEPISETMSEPMSELYFDDSETISTKDSYSEPRIFKNIFKEIENPFEKKPLIEPPIIEKPSLEPVYIEEEPSDIKKSSYKSIKTYGTKPIMDAVYIEEKKPIIEEKTIINKPSIEPIFFEEEKKPSITKDISYTTIQTPYKSIKTYGTKPQMDVVYIEEEKKPIIVNIEEQSIKIPKTRRKKIEMEETRLMETEDIKKSKPIFIRPKIIPELISEEIVPKNIEKKLLESIGEEPKRKRTPRIKTNISTFA